MALLKHDDVMGMSYEDFLGRFSPEKKIRLRPARLIPPYKLGDELALTSVFLSAFRLVSEFRKQISSAVGMKSSGNIHVFTEITFEEGKALRPDGMIVIVRGGKVVDAALLEMKNANNEIQPEQIDQYLAIAKKFNIPRIITVSNQFVSHPAQCPINIKNKIPKNISLFHLSWSYILTVAHILLFDNDMNIEDPDQVEIMNEVVKYFEYEKSGISGFNRMKPGWAETVKKINEGSEPKSNDPDLFEAAESWIQEEKDMALILSRELGLLIETGDKKYRYDYSGRLNSEVAKILDPKKGYVESRLYVEGAASPINIRANFNRRNIEMSVSVNAPHDSKTIRGQFGWLKRQLATCESKDTEKWTQIESELRFDVSLKYGETQRLQLSEFDGFIENNKDKLVKEFVVVHVKDLGKSFSSTMKFVQIIEKMLREYYGCLVQYLKKWEPPAPKMQKNSYESNDETPE